MTSVLPCVWRARASPIKQAKPTMPHCVPSRTPRALGVRKSAQLRNRQTCPAHRWHHCGWRAALGRTPQHLPLVLLGIVSQRACASASGVSGISRNCNSHTARNAVITSIRCRFATLWKRCRSRRTRLRISTRQCSSASASPGLEDAEGNAAILAAFCGLEARAPMDE